MEGNIISGCPFGVAFNLRGKLGHVSIKKSLKIPKGKSQVVKRIWTGQDNGKKGQKDKQLSTKLYTGNKRESNMNPSKIEVNSGAPEG